MTTANEIPVAHTPEGFWRGAMPPPILEGCTETLPDGVPDFRGLWHAVSVEVNGEPVDDLSHVERIEQCGDRVVITAGGIIHDMRADGTLEHGVNDVGAGSGVPIHVAAVFEQGVLALRPNGGEIAVTRELDGDELIWILRPFNRVTRMRRELDH